MCKHTRSACARAHAVCGLHKWDRTLILPNGGSQSAFHASTPGPALGRRTAGRLASSGRALVPHRCRAAINAAVALHSPERFSGTASRKQVRGAGGTHFQCHSPRCDALPRLCAPLQRCERPLLHALARSVLFCFKDLSFLRGENDTLSFYSVFLR